MERVETLILDAGGVSPAEEDASTRGKRQSKHTRSFTVFITQHHLGEEVMYRLCDEKLARLIA